MAEPIRTWVAPNLMAVSKSPLMPMLSFEIPLRAASGLKCRVLRRNRGWCDDPADRNYNRLVKLPYPGCHESLWRDDELYDVIVVLGYNDCPRRRGKGSAIFFHLAAPIGRPTQGCLAVSRKDMLKVLALCGPETRIKVW